MEPSCRDTTERAAKVLPCTMDGNGEDLSIDLDLRNMEILLFNGSPLSPEQSDSVHHLLEQGELFWSGGGESQSFRCFGLAQEMTESLFNGSYATSLILAHQGRLQHRSDR